MQRFENETDEAMVRLAQEGNEEAVDYLLTKYKPLVLKLSRARFLAGGEKEDLIQEGMIGLYKAVRDYNTDTGARFSTFAALCIDRQMLHAIEASLREKNQPLNNSVSLTDEEWELAGEVPSLSPESIVVGQTAFSERIARLRESLSPMENSVLDLYLDGHGYKEIARILRKEPKAIDNTFQRIRKKSRL